MKISVVIPTYKRAEKLSRAIKSVLEQTYQDFEINVVSDGYDEPTDMLMKEYLNDERINYYYYTKNRGGNYARNYGIKKSDGDFIAFLDDDDLWKPEKLKKQYEIFQKNDKIGLVYTGSENKFPKLNITYLNLPQEDGDLSKKIFINNYIGSTSSVMIKKEILNASGLFDEDMPAMQDYELWIRICQKTEIGCVNEPLLTYINEEENNQISANVNKKLKALKLIEKKHSEILNENIEYKNILERRTQQNILRIMQRNNDKENLERYTKKYLNKYSDIKAYIFILTTKIPYKYLLKLRSYKKN